MTYQLYKALIKPLRDADAADGNLLLQRFLIGPQAEHDRRQADILSLFDQIKADKVRADLLQYLMPIVGFTNELRAITDRLDEASQRRLINVAVALWNERFTRQGLVNAIRLLTGRNAYYTDWFTYRSILGEVTLTEDQLTSGGDFWVIGGDVSTYDEFWSNIRLMDDGTLDELLLIDVIRLMRPIGERFEVAVMDFLDQFDIDLNRWTQIAGATAPSISNGTMLVPQDTAMRPVAPIPDGMPTGGAPITNNNSYNIVTKFNLVSSSSVLRCRFYLDHNIFTGDGGGAVTGNNAFEVRVYPGNCELWRFDNNVATLLARVTPPSIVPGTWYKLRVETQNVPDGSSVNIRVLIDGNNMIPGVGSTWRTGNATTPSGGPYFFMAKGGAIYLDNVESWRNPMRFATVELSNASQPGGQVTMTSNFIV